MLIRQAYLADEAFTNSKLDPSLIDTCIRAISAIKQNIVLIGMPTSGKSTIGKQLAEKLNRPFVDMDSEIQTKIGGPIASFIQEEGEPAFRAIEQEVAKELRTPNGIVIASGGGVVTQPETMRVLAENGVIYWIDRPFNLLQAEESRPLSANRKDLEEMAKKRKPLYQRYCDGRIENTSTIETAVEELQKQIENGETHI